MSKYNFTLTRTTSPKQKPNPDTLRFGKTFTDHMLIMDWSADKGWHDGRIVPYGPLQLDPAASVLHYSQQMFEGLKAYKTEDGRILLFRPDMNAKRTNKTNERMCIPELPEDLFIEAVKAIVDVERDWIPSKPGTSLYIRPFIFADEAFLGVHVAGHYKFCIILSPVGAYYASSDGGLTANSIFVEQHYVRAVPGGTGFAKVGGNYAGSLIAQKKAAEKGCDQVLWLDSTEHDYVEEIGTSNAFFVIDDEIITAPLAGTILPGITRDSVLALLRKWGLNVSERRLKISEVLKAGEEGRLQEVFATGTAAVISPVGKLVFEDKAFTVGNGGVGELSNKLYSTLYGIQTGKVEDDMGWTMSL